MPEILKKLQIIQAMAARDNGIAQEKNIPMKRPFPVNPCGGPGRELRPGALALQNLNGLFFHDAGHFAASAAPRQDPEATKLYCQL
ncbi:MAG: hypothetical protein ACOX9C_02395 [Kiritimatiellia bacterium]